MRFVKKVKNMIENTSLHDTLFGIGQIFGVLLLLEGAYLSALEPVLFSMPLDEDKQERGVPNLKMLSP